ncbi:MAG TPA: ornithine cyclodeaminase family protein [Ramlibacter sp.]|jgi:ornithine cyclodeaminase|nr:ornithine cyclodeaminase family protein [Ramlibacter sp.]
MQTFDAAATEAALPFDRLVPALRALFAGGCEVPTRHVHEVAVPGGTPFTSLIMPAWIPGRYYGIKVINIAPGNAQRGLPGLHASYLLHDGTTGVPLALIDGDVLTTRRTAATSALAADWLAPRDARRLLVVGAGRIARLLPHAYRTVRPIDEVLVWARDAAKAQALAREWQDQGLAARAVADLAAACGSADIVSCATLAPVVHGAWLRPGTHLDLIGSFTPAMREADDACFAGAALYLDTEEALKKSGELLGPLQRGVITPADVRGTLATLARAAATVQRDLAQRTVFKSVGLALEDLAAAMLVVEGKTTG